MPTLPTRSGLNKTILIVMAGFITAGCARMMTRSTTIDSFDTNAGVEITGISIKGNRSGGNSYRFKEETSYSLHSFKYDKKMLSVVKTICVASDCKATQSHKINSNSGAPVKMSFVVHKSQIADKFTITTQLLLMNSVIATHSYEFYPKDCLESACKQ